VAEPKEPLTERELEVVRLVADGASNKQIAASLHIAENTVKVHLKNIFVKLEADSRTRVAMIAQRNGWAAIPQTGESPADEPSTPDDSASVATPESVLPVRTVVPVAPNPEPLPPLPLWRKALSVLAISATILGGVFSLQRNTTNAQISRGNEFSASGSSASVDAAVAASGGSRWFARAPLPSARTRVSAVAVGQSIYVVGGAVDGKPSGETRVFDPAANTWRVVDPKPTPVWLASVVALDDLVIAAGGTTADGAATARVEAYDTRSRTWRALPPLPRALTGHAAVAFAGRVYVFGGRLANEALNPEGYALDVTRGVWTRIPGPPTLRSQAALAAFEGRLYLVGGFDGQREYNVCETYNVAENRWSGCRSMSIARGGLGLARVGAQLYAVGGGVGGNYIPYNERFDPGTGRWLPFEIPGRRAGAWHNMGIAALPTEFYTFGGTAGGEALSDASVYEVLTRRTFIPALRNSEATP
jgi:DNA-binding CsgD family transcriptional regulator/N-acetylneuraminic acid mutarotase